MADYVFSEKDNGASAQVQRGAKITIELKENPTTGYRWTISSIDEVLLEPEGDEFLPPDQATPGAGGLRRFLFRAKDAGSTVLTLINKRAWQRDDQAVGAFNLIICILN
ncbi:MAG: peptidase inhibitor I42 [Verrucomicrobia bacterium]|nr:MAG: peptidase inhibitor I42 [Verrucomicrobiota bacterium]